MHHNIVIKVASKRGFTLMELLVVIAIIGILASVVLASLNIARARGADAAVKETLANMRAQATLFYDNNSQSYTNVCAGAGGLQTLIDGADTANLAGAVQCVYDTANTPATGWAVEAELVTDPSLFFCVDYTGAATTTAATSNLSGTEFVCDGI